MTTIPQLLEKIKSVAACYACSLDSDEQIAIATECARLMPIITAQSEAIAELVTALEFFCGYEFNYKADNALDSARKKLEEVAK